MSKLNQNLEKVPSDMCNKIKDQISNDYIDGAFKSLFDLIDSSLPPADQKINNPEKSDFPKKFLHKKKKKKTKSWFDKELQMAKKNLNKLSNLKNKFPYNNEIRNDHNEALKGFRRTCQSKKSSFLKDTFDGMNTALNDTENFWKDFRKFSDKRLPKSTITDKISANDWKSYFESVHTENREQNIPHLVEKAPNEELNKPFNFEELKRVIKKNEK